MLENLDNVDWKNLSHAYGEADDIPELIKDLISKNSADRDNALWGLYGTIWHQGTIYSATSYSIPFLIEILENNGPVTLELLIFLNHLVTGYSKNKDFLVTIKSEFEKGFKTYVKFLNSKKLDEQIFAVYLLSCFENKKNEITELYIKLFEDDKERKLLKAVIGLCIGLLLQNNLEIYKKFEDLLLANNDNFIKLAVLLGYIKVYKDKISEKNLNGLKRLLNNWNLFLDLQKLNTRGSEMAHENLFDYFKELNLNQLELLIDSLIEILKKEEDGNNGLNMANALLSFAFKEYNEKNPVVLVKELNNLQKKILVGFINSPAVWHYANISGDLRRAGINCGFKVVESASGDSYLSYRRGLANFLKMDYFDPEEVFNEALICKNNKEYEKAFNKFKRLISHNDRIPEYFHCAGHMKILQNNREEAKTYLKKAIELYLELLEKNPNHAKTLFWVAAAYSLLQDKKHSFKFLKKAINIDEKYKKEAANEEDFEEYYEDPDFIKLTKEIIKFRKFEKFSTDVEKSPSIKKYTEKEIEDINYFSELLDKAKWQEARNWNIFFKNSINSGINVEPPVFGRYFGEKSNLEIGLHYEEKWYVRLLIGLKDLTDALILRFYYRDMFDEILDTILDKQDILDLQNYYDELVLYIKESCEFVLIEKQDGTLLEIE